MSTTRKCVFPHCTSRGLTGFYQLPKDEIRRNEWLDICGLSESQVKKRSLICSNHFSPEDLQLNNGKYLLKPGAKPNPPTPDEIFETTASDVNNYVVQEEIQNYESIPEIDLSGSVNDSEHNYAATCASCERLKSDLLFWRKKFHNLENKYEELKAATSPNNKKFCDEITTKRLLENGHFSKPQIQVMLRYNKDTNPNPKSNKWTRHDLLLSKELLGIKEKSLDFVRKVAGLPLHNG